MPALSAGSEVGELVRLGDRPQAPSDERGETLGVRKGSVTGRTANEASVPAHDPRPGQVLNSGLRQVGNDGDHVDWVR